MSSIAELGNPRIEVCDTRLLDWLGQRAVVVTAEVRGQQRSVSYPGRCPNANLAPKALSINFWRLSDDWQAVYGHRVVLAETFFDPDRLRGPAIKPRTVCCSEKRWGMGRKAGEYDYHGQRYRRIAWVPQVLKGYTDFLYLEQIFRIERTGRNLQESSSERKRSMGSRVSPNSNRMHEGCYNSIESIGKLKTDCIGFGMSPSMKIGAKSGRDRAPGPWQRYAI